MIFTLKLQLTKFMLESCSLTRSWQNCIILFPSIFDMWISTKYFLSAVIRLHTDITTQHTSLAPQHIVGIYVRNNCITVNTSSPSHGELFKASMLIQWGIFPGIRREFKYHKECQEISGMFNTFLPQIHVLKDLNHAFRICNTLQITCQIHLLTIKGVT